MFTKKRIGEPKTINEPYSERSAFERDHDRIVYSNYFRRLHDKTQVFPYAPLSASSQARSRLSHSLEVSCVARSLGMLVGAFISEKFPEVRPYDIGMCVASASLAHDIGNPPFGHSGEDAIRHWAERNISSFNLSKHEELDIVMFEGNAQGFRILSRLEIWQRRGSIRPAAATIGAFSKYPCSSILSAPKSSDISRKKFGYFLEDASLFDEAFSLMEIPHHAQAEGAYPRHPLSFLSEAADDICYGVIDLEDAYHLGIISFEKVNELLLPIASKDPEFRYDDYHDKDIKIARLRSAAINLMTGQVYDVFMRNFDSILSFGYSKPLIEEIESASNYITIYDFSLKNIYSSSRVLEIEYAGFKAIGGLLDIFVPAVMSDKPNKEQKLSRKLIPQVYFKRCELADKYTAEMTSDDYIELLSPYQKMLSVTDYICGMTDRYAIELFQKLKGSRI